LVEVEDKDEVEVEGKKRLICYVMKEGMPGEPAPDLFSV
jgi:hypothetical protein